MKNAKRPTVLSIVCMIGFAWVLFTFTGVFSPSVKKLGVFMPAIYGLIIAATFISFIGVWHMKRWGTELYVISFCEKFFFLCSHILFVLAAFFGFFFLFGFRSFFLIT